MPTETAPTEKPKYAIVYRTPGGLCLTWQGGLRLYEAMFDRSGAERFLGPEAALGTVEVVGQEVADARNGRNYFDDPSVSRTRA